jgi:hypothetical protein
VRKLLQLASSKISITLAKIVTDNTQRGAWVTAAIEALRLKRFQVEIQSE